MNGEDGRILLNELHIMTDFIKENWMDPLGKEYVLWLERTQNQIKTMERKREILGLKKEKIRLICEDICANGDADNPKTLTLKRK